MTTDAIDLLLRDTMRHRWDTDWLYIALHRILSRCRPDAAAVERCFGDTAERRIGMTDHAPDEILSRALKTWNGVDLLLHAKLTAREENQEGYNRGQEDQQIP